MDQGKKTKEKKGRSWQSLRRRGSLTQFPFAVWRIRQEDGVYIYLRRIEQDPIKRNFQDLAGAPVFPLFRDITHSTVPSRCCDWSPPLFWLYPSPRALSIINDRPYIEIESPLAYTLSRAIQSRWPRIERKLKTRDSDVSIPREKRVFPAGILVFIPARLVRTRGHDGFE